MGGPERVVDVDVRVGGQRGRELGVVLLLGRVEPEVLEEQQLARPEPVDRVLRADPEGIPGDRHVPAEQLGQPLPHRTEPQAVRDLAVRPAEMAGEDQAGALVEEGRDGRDGRPDPGVVRDLAVGERDVEVHPHEDALAREVRIADRQLVHVVGVERGQAATGRRAATWAIRSATRQL